MICRNLVEYGTFLQELLTAKLGKTGFFYLPAFQNSYIGNIHVYICYYIYM